MRKGKETNNFLRVNAFWQEFEIWYMANYLAVHRIQQQNSKTTNFEFFANLSTNEIIFEEKSNYKLANQVCKTCSVVGLKTRKIRICIFGIGCWIRRAR